MSHNKSWNWHGKSDCHEWKHEDKWRDDRWGNDGGHGWKQEDDCDWGHGSKERCW